MRRLSPKLWLALAVVAALVVAAVVVLGGGEDAPRQADEEPEPTLFVAPDGRDRKKAGRTRERPLRSLNEAYRRAKPGETIEVAAGDYPRQEIAFLPQRRSDDDVRFVPAGDVSFPSLVIGGKHVTFDGPFQIRSVAFDGDNAEAEDATVRGVDMQTAYIAGAQDVALLESDIGPNAGTESDDGLFAGTALSSGVRIEGNHFHDITRPDPVNSHSDCIQFTMGVDVTIKGNTFERCYDQTIIIKGDQGELTRFTIEGNTVGQPDFGPFGLTLTGDDTPCQDCTVTGNTFMGAPRIDAPADGTSRVTANTLEAYAENLCADSMERGWQWDANTFESPDPCGTNATAPAEAP